ncbi:hypothetical protein KY289_027529 [Solanum tuberosum]|nr:hypothetical protein KY289_027529 [Solanum tuberosum]
MMTKAIFPYFLESHFSWDPILPPKLSDFKKGAFEQVTHIINCKGFQAPTEFTPHSSVLLYREYSNLLAELNGSPIVFKLMRDHIPRCLSKDLLKLRNDLLTYELEREKLAMELEEDKRSQKE